MLKKYNFRNYRFRLIIYVSILTIIGILIIGSAKESVQNKQILGFILGIIVMFVVSIIDYSYWIKFKWLLYAAMMLLLLMVRFAGVNRGGATRWIVIAGIQFQPSELAKIVLIIIISAFYMKHQNKINNIKTIGLSFLIAAPILFLILKQPDTSTTLLCVFILIVLLFIAGLSYKIVLTVLGIIVPIGVVGITYILNNADKLVAKHYQFKRIMAWIFPNDPKYYEFAIQQNNSIMAIGSGQLYGKGLNNSVATSLKNADYIIEPQTDFIFAVAGEELGFIGELTIILLFVFVIIECILIARKAKDLSGKLICCGIAALIGFQAFINMCVATGLMPNTGIPLPFVSYGLTSLVSIYIGIGLVLNVGLQPKKY